MLERVRQIGGALEIHSKGNGTSVLVTLPLAKREMKAEEILKKERATSQS
jgi:signal transduction histidine kinase